MGGATIAGIGDVGSAYYNPAAISRAQSSKFALNSSVITFQLNKFIDNESGRAFSTETLFTVPPRSFSFMFKPKKESQVYFEFMSIIRTEDLLYVDEGLEFYEDVNSEMAGDELIKGDISLASRYRDSYVGGGIGYNLNENWSIGVSMFLSIKNFDQTNSLNITIRPTADSFYYEGESGPAYTSISHYDDAISINQMDLVWKGGINYLAKKVSFGITFTTPSLRLSEKSFVSSLVNQTNFRSPETGEIESFIVQDFQKNVNGRIKTPFSIAAGGRFHTADDKVQFTVTAEYFFPIAAYRLVTGEENPLSTDPATYERLPVKDFLTYANAADEVFNLAVGFRFKFKNEHYLYSGFRTDFSSRAGWDLEDLAQYKVTSTLNVDLYHVTAGATFRIFGSDLLLGGQYSYGKGKNQAPLFGTGDELFSGGFARPLGDAGSATLVQHKFSLFIGFTFNFGSNKEKEEIEDL